MNQRFNFSYFGKDFSAGLVVFLVALPLCLGIAHASDAPPMAGIISGVIGGIVVGAISGSNLGVSGPAAGLASIIGTAIKDLGAFEIFLVAVVVAGIIQIILGVIGAGKIAYYFPSSVIKGMLAAIGIIIILKEIPHLFGIDKDPVGESSFDQPDGENTFTELLNLDHMILGAVIIGLSCFAVLLIWETKYIKKRKILANIPAPLLAVLVGFFMNKFFPPHLALGSEHMVQLPVFSASDGASSILTFPKFSAITNWEVLKIGIVIAVVASLETLLCVEATDRLDPKKNITPTNRELIAQGTGNVVSGLIGGLPVTQVIVRSSANINAGGQTKISAIVHGILLMACVLFIPNILNSIPEAALAAILIVVGYKLANLHFLRKCLWKDKISLSLSL
ncbi:MAG: SulP family inorganic anion transporter [Bacteroidia bacterium]